VHFKMSCIKPISFIILLLAFFSCKKAHTNNAATTVDSNQTTVFAKGADISWVTQMEASGYKFYDSTGKQTDCFALMKELGMNAVRLRIWVNPAGGWCDSADVLAKAIRANNQGLKILLDFHYSDVWADPGDQNKPAAWAGLNTAALISEVYTYTFNTLTWLKANGIVPAWVVCYSRTEKTRSLPLQTSRK
jgi:arabinogalactan endo-1,4-beta-galactosidase